jgi:hypothetical protein
MKYTSIVHDEHVGIPYTLNHWVFQTLTYKDIMELTNHFLKIRVVIVSYFLITNEKSRLKLKNLVLCETETETESNCRIIWFDSIRLRRIKSNPNWDPVEPNRVEWMIFSRSRIESNPNHNFLNYSELLHRFYSNRNESNEDFLEHGRIESNRVRIFLKTVGSNRIEYKLRRIESNPNRDFLILFGLWKL